MVEVKSARDLERFARTAETLEIRAESHGKKHYLTGPKDNDGRIYWPDALLMSKSLHKEGEKLVEKQMVKVIGNLVRITFENGHGEYYSLGEHADYLVLNKISCSIDHQIAP